MSEFASAARDACSSRTARNTRSSIDCSAESAHRLISEWPDIEDSPKFSRCRDTASVELRGECPRLTVDVLDAVSGSRRITRTELVNQILGEWARQQLHEASLIARVTRGNPEAAELFPSTTD